MTKADFINHLATKLNITKAEADNVFSAVFETLTDVLANQDKMMAPGQLKQLQTLLPSSKIS